MKKLELTVKDSSLSFISAFLFGQIAIIIFSCISILISNIFKISLEQYTLFTKTSIGYLLSALVFDLTLILIFFIKNNNRENSIVSKPKLSKVAFYSILGPLALLMLYPIVNCCDTLLFKFNIVPNSISYKLTTQNYLISIVSLALLPAIAEELIFRGLIFKGLKKYSKTFSIIISAVMFSLFHMSINQIVYPLLMGLLLGVIMYNENNIIYCMLAHFFNNFASLTISYLNLKLSFNHWTYIIFAIVLVLIYLSVVIHLIIKNRPKSQKLSLQDKKYLIFSISFMILIWIMIFLSSLGVIKN